MTVRIIRRSGLFCRCRGGRCGRRSRGGGRGRRGAASGGRRGGSGGGCRLRLRGGIDPASVNAAVEGFGHLGVDLAAEAGQAAECRLDMPTGTAKPVVEIEVTKGGIEVVEPHQPYHAATEPDAFRVAGRAVDGLRCFNELVGLALIVPGRIRRGGRICRRFARLILGPKVAALRKRASDTDQECKTGDGEVTQDRILKLKHTSTHKVPDCFLPAARPDALV
jgi:hypothetical protein